MNRIHNREYRPGRWLFFLASLIPLFSSAQTFSQKQIREWSRNPEWVQMMDDSNANYFAVVAAFEAFWKNRELPVEEDQVLGAPREERGKEYTRRELHQREREERKRNKEEREAEQIRNQYAFDVKKYNHWKHTVEPYVQSDGRILTKEEQLQLREQQRP